MEVYDALEEEELRRRLYETEYDFTTFLNVYGYNQDFIWGMFIFITTLNMTFVASLPLQIVPMLILLAYFFVPPLYLIFFEPNKVYFSLGNFMLDVYVRLVLGTFLTYLTFVITWLTATYPFHTIIYDYYTNGSIELVDYDW